MVAEKSAKSATPASASLKAERDRFVALAFCWADALIELDDNEKVVFAGGATAPLLGRKSKDLIGLPVGDLIAPPDRALLRSLLSIARKRGRIENVGIRLQGTGGATAPLSFAGYRLDDLGGHYFLAFRMATAAAKAAARGATRDADSGLYDANGFADVITQHIETRDAKSEDSQMTLIALPDFEELRERMGEEEEHNLLNTVGACLRASSVDGDSAARIADDRYGLVHDNDLDIDGLESQIVDFTREFDPQGIGVQVETATIEVDAEALAEEDLASGLIYTINQFRTAKGSEFNIKNLSTNLSILANKAAKSVSDFKHVVAEAKFDIAFQPIIDVATGEIHHYEALCRFHASDKDASPYEYITFAEETGLIADFDMAMASKVMQWLANTPRYRVAINISGFSVSNLKYVDDLNKLLRGNTWARDRAIFEITESARLEDLGAANHFIQTLRKQGHEVCLDDFGAGAANFQYLSTLEVDVVKLDGSAVRNAQRARKGKAFLKALVGLCRELDIDTIAEMVDDESGLRFIRDCGVKYVQGYLFGKPSRDIKVFEKQRMKHLFPSSRRS